MGILEDPKFFSHKAQLDVQFAQALMAGLAEEVIRHFCSCANYDLNPSRLGSMLGKTYISYRGSR